MPDHYDDTKKSEVINDVFIDSQGSRAKEIRSNPETLLQGLGRPVPGPGLVPSMFSGAAAGFQVGQHLSPYASPETALLSGALSGYQGFQQAQEQAIENTPIEQISPAIVEAIPAARGLSFGQFKQLKDSLVAITKQQRPTITIGTAAQLKALRPDLNDEQILSIDEPTAAKYVLEFTKQSGAKERAEMGKKSYKYEPMVVNGKEVGTMEIEETTGRRTPKWNPMEINKLTEQEIAILSEQTGISPEFLSDVKRNSIALLGLTPKPLSPEAAKNISSAESGIKQINRLLEFYTTSPNARSVLTKIGGAGATVASLGDAEAQKILNASKEAADVITRLRTGAALNIQEEKYYGSLLRNRWNTLEAQVDALNTVRNFLESVNNDLQQGKRIMYTTPKGGGNKKKESPKESDTVELF